LYRNLENPHPPLSLKKGEGINKGNPCNAEDIEVEIASPAPFIKGVGSH